MVILLLAAVPNASANVRSHTCDWQSNHYTRLNNYFFRIISFVSKIIIIVCATNKNYSETKKFRNKFASKKFDYIYELVCWIDLGRLVFHFEIG